MCCVCLAVVSTANVHSVRLSTGLGADSTARWDTDRHVMRHTDTYRQTDTWWDTQTHHETHRHIQTDRHVMRHTDTYRQTDTWWDTHTDTQTHHETHRQTYTDRQTRDETHRQTHTDRQTHHETHRHIQTDRHVMRHTDRQTDRHITLHMISLHCIVWTMLGKMHKILINKLSLMLASVEGNFYWGKVHGRILRVCLGVLKAVLQDSWVFTGSVWGWWVVLECRSRSPSRTTSLLGSNQDYHFGHCG